jgi:hypothetical protein
LAMQFRYPRSFLYCGIPYYLGEPLLSARGDSQYSFYCNWLVEYLDKLGDHLERFGGIPPSQRDLCAELDLMKPDTAAFWLGHDGFY